MVATTGALASFEDKWSLAHPELPLALRFTPAPVRPVVSALACVGFEVGLATFGVGEAAVAASKLQWWAEELALLSRGQARHPLTQVLAESPSLRALPAETWQAWLGAAFAQREFTPARGLAELLEGYRGFHDPLCRIQSAIHPGLSVRNAAQAGALSRVLMDTIRLSESTGNERLPLPLDLLARHGLTRAGLARAGKQRDNLLREHFAALADAAAAIGRSGLSPMMAASLASDQARCRLAARAENPLEAGSLNLDRLPFSALWACWRAARRMQPAP